MPMVVVAVVAAVVTAGVGAAATAALAGVITGTILGVSAAAIVGTAIGTLAGVVVAYAGGQLVQSMAAKPKARDAGGTAAEAQDAKRLVRGSAEARRIHLRPRPRIWPADLCRQLWRAKRMDIAGDSLWRITPAKALTLIWLGETRIAAAEIDGNGLVVGGRFANNVYVRRYLGTQTSADSDLVANSPDGWAAADKLTGITYIYLRMRFNADLFPYGIPNISAEVTGKSAILDPRTSTTAYANNWALCILDYLKAEYGLAATNDEIDLPSFIAAANLADEAVPLNLAGTETQKRYTLDGSFTLDEAPIDVIEKMLAPGGGALVYVAGKYRLYGGAYNAPAITLTPSDMAGDFEVTTKPPRRDLFNSVRGNFIDLDRYWQSSEFPPQQAAALITEDGEEIWREIDLPFVLDATRAQRIAKQLLFRARQSIMFKGSFRYASLDLTVWQVVALTIPDLGWVAKPFRIMSWSFSPESGLISLIMQEEQASSYAWTYDAAANTPDIADTTLISPFNVVAPKGLAATESLYVTRDGAGVRTAVALDFLPPENPFIREYQVQYAPEGSTDWRAATGVLASPAQVLDLASGTYDFRVRAVTAAAEGQWAYLRFSVGGLAAQPPGAVTGLNLQSIGGFAWLGWDRHPEIDVRIGGRFEIRHSPSVGGPPWANATSLGPALSGEATYAPVPLRAGTYLIRPVDAGGVYGAAASIEASQATALPFANVASVQEDAGFTGAKADVLASSGVLKLDNAGNWDSIASVDAVVDVDALGLSKPSGVYTFAGGIDLGSVKSIRLSAHLLANVVAFGANWDQRVSPIDEWGRIDDVFGGEADAWVESRLTNDNPGGSPTWSAWQRLDSAEFKARGFQFRAQLRSYQPEFNIEVTQLRVAADEVV
jgi:hypothetical protein